MTETSSAANDPNAQERFRMVFEAAPNAMIMVDVEGCMTLVNTQAEQLFGYQRLELIGQRIETLVPERYRSAHRGHRAFFSAHPSTRSMGAGRDLFGLRKDGREVPIEIGLNPVRTDEGVFVLASIIDITERKQAEIALTQLAAIVESSDDAIIGKDLNGVITSWNRGAEKIFGFTAKEMVGTSIMRLIPADRRDEENYILAKIKRGEGVEHFETQRLVEDGRLIDVSVTVSPIKDPNGKVIGVSKVARDMTQRNQADREIRRLNEELEQRVADRTTQLEAANKELEAFSYSVSHDLRAPLRHIDGFSQALLEDYADKLDEGAKSYLREVRNASQEMAQLIDDMLQLARVTRSEMHREGVNLSQTARAVIAELRKMNPERTVSVSIAEGLWTRGDKRLLKIMLDNLLANAWKFTSQRQSANVAFGAEKKNGETVYFVRDNGAGFDMAYVSKLFGAFQRLHTVSEFEGTGIGLATVQRIVHRHGGRVWAEGNVNQGASFYFTLPNSKEESDGPQSNSTG